METSECLRHVVPPTTTWVTVPPTRIGRADAMETLLQLPAGTAIVLTDRRLGSRRRSRALARRARVRIDRELLAIPTVEAPVYAVEDVPAAVATFWRSFVTVPPGVVAPALPLTIVIRMVATLRVWGVVGAFVPGRLTVGRRA